MHRDEMLFLDSIYYLFVVAVFFIVMLGEFCYYPVYFFEIHLLIPFQSLPKYQVIIFGFHKTQICFQLLEIKFQ